MGRARDWTKGRKGTSDPVTRENRIYKESKRLNTGFEGAKELGL